MFLEDILTKQVWIGGATENVQPGNIPPLVVSPTKQNVNCRVLLVHIPPKLDSSHHRGVNCAELENSVLKWEGINPALKNVRLVNIPIEVGSQPTATAKDVPLVNFPTALGLFQKRGANSANQVRKKIWMFLIFRHVLTFYLFTKLFFTTGKFSSTVGLAHSCTDRCTAGKFSDKPGLTSNDYCSKCKSGQYSTETGSPKWNCKTCPDGFTTNGLLGSSVCKKTETKPLSPNDILIIVGGVIFVVLGSCTVITLFYRRRVRRNNAENETQMIGEWYYTPLSVIHKVIQFKNLTHISHTSLIH